MRNKYSGVCYYCHKRVAPGEGHFELNKDYPLKSPIRWKLIHAKCVFQQRKDKGQEPDKYHLKKV